MIHFQSLAPNLVVADVNETVNFYTSVLGFTFITSVPQEGTFHWAMVQRDQVTVMFQTRESLQEDMPALQIGSGGSPGTFFIRIEGVEEYASRLRGTVRMVHDLRTTFYGMKEITIQDLNGYYLTFAEEAT